MVLSDINFAFQILKYSTRFLLSDNVVPFSFLLSWHPIRLGPVP